MCKGTCPDASCQSEVPVSDQNPVERGGADLQAGSVVGLLRDFLGFVSSRGKVGIGVAQEKGRHQLEIRQLRKDRSKRLEKLGREVIALVSAGELEHPGLSVHMGHIQQLDERIQAQLAQGSPTSSNDAPDGEE